MYERYMLCIIFVAVCILIGMAWGIVDRLDALALRSIGSM